MNTQQALKILELKRGFTRDDLKRSFYRLSKKHHPDIDPGNRNFILIKEAYDFLSESVSDQAEASMQVFGSTFNRFCQIMADYLYYDRLSGRDQQRELLIKKERALQQLKKYRLDVLAADEQLTAPQRKMIDYFISLFLDFYGDYRKFSYSYLVMQNVKSSSQFGDLYATEEKMTELIYAFFTQFIKGRDRKRKKINFEKRIKLLIRKFEAVFQESFYLFNQDLREYCDNVYFLLSGFEKIVVVRGLLAAVRIDKTA